MDIFNFAVDLNKSFNKVMPIAAIWITDQNIYVNGKKKVRFADGDEVRVCCQHLQNISEDFPATHTIKRCLGNIGNTVLYFELINKKTGELITLNLK